MAQRDCRGSMILLDALQAKAKRVVEEWISMVRRRACCAPAVMLGAREGCEIWDGEGGVGKEGSEPVGFVEDDEFLTTGWQGDFLLSKALDAVADDVDAFDFVPSAILPVCPSPKSPRSIENRPTSFITSIQLQNGLLIRIPQHLPSQT